MNKIRVIHIKNTRKAEEYGYTVFRIDRQTPVGNPFIMHSESERDQVCDAYREWFRGQLVLESSRTLAFHAYLNKIKQAHQQGNIALACWCAPKRCHGDTIKAWLEGTL
jgi:hypothetical protein